MKQFQFENEHDEMYMEKDLIENTLFKIIGQFNEKKITPIKFYSIRLNKIHPFYDRKDGTFEILF